MRITEDTRFPHPVLSPYSADYTSGEFSVAFEAFEDPATCALQLDYAITLTEPAILELVTSGRATIGCFVRCGDTYYTELRQLSWPMGRTDFRPGSLLNRVVVQPIIWLNAALRAWNPGTIHPEFSPPLDLDPADIVAVGVEAVLSIGQAKFAEIESIFELRRAPGVPEGEMRIDPDGDRIGIVVAPGLFDVINVLRGQADGQPVVMNGVYLPAVMEVLDLLTPGRDQYEAQRWHQPFLAKCDAKGIEPSPGMSVLEAAQSLLEVPLRGLRGLLGEGQE